jgi:hypothetical protein
MPRCAMPEHLNDKEEIENAFPDDSQYKGWFGRLYTRFQKSTKTWFAFSFRCKFWPKGWKYPKTLFAIGDKSSWRYEQDGMDDIYSFNPYDRTEGRYISRIQYFKRWSLVIQRPGIITFHWYPKAGDVPEPGKPLPETDGKVWFGYWGHFDGDLVYWLIKSLFLGKAFK